MLSFHRMLLKHPFSYYYENLNLNAFRMLSQGRESNPRSLLSKQSLRRCKLASLSLCICGWWRYPPFKGHAHRSGLYSIVSTCQRSWRLHGRHPCSFVYPLWRFGAPIVAGKDGVEPSLTAKSYMPVAPLYWSFSPLLFVKGSGLSQLATW